MDIYNKLLEKKVKNIKLSIMEEGGQMGVSGDYFKIEKSIVFVKDKGKVRIMR